MKLLFSKDILLLFVLVQPVIGYALEPKKEVELNNTLKKVGTKRKIAGPENINSRQGKKRRTRNSAVACVSCRRKHKKCTRGNPCEGCKKSKISCIYVKAKKPGPKKRLRQDEESQIIKNAHKVGYEKGRKELAFAKKNYFNLEYAAAQAEAEEFVSEMGHLLTEEMPEYYMEIIRKKLEEKLSNRGNRLVNKLLSNLKEKESEDFGVIQIYKDFSHQKNSVINDLSNNFGGY